MLCCQEQLDRPLADIARSPCRAAGLLQTVGHGEMDHGVVCVPPDCLVQDVSLFPCDCGCQAKMVHQPAVVVEARALFLREGVPCGALVPVRSKISANDHTERGFCVDGERQERLVKGGVILEEDAVVAGGKAAVRECHVIV